MGLVTTCVEAIEQSENESLVNRLFRYLHNKDRRETSRKMLNEADNSPTKESLEYVVKRCRDFNHKKELKRTVEICVKHGFFDEALIPYGVPSGKKYFKDKKAVYKIGIEAARQGKCGTALEIFKHANIPKKPEPEFYKTLSSLILDLIRHNQNVKPEEINKEYCNGKDVVKSIDVQNGDNRRKVVIDYGDGIVFTYTKQDITRRSQRNSVEFHNVVNPFEKEESVLKFYRDKSNAMKEAIFLKALEGLDVPALISSEDFGDYKLNQLSKIEGEPFAEAVKNMSRERKKALFEQAIEINGKIHGRIREKEDFVLEELAGDGIDLTEQYCNERFSEAIGQLRELDIDDLAEKLNEHYKQIMDELVGNPRFIVNFDYRPRNILLNNGLAIVDHEVYKRAHPVFSYVSLIYNTENGFDDSLREGLKQKSINELAKYGIAPEESEHLWLPSVIFWEARMLRRELRYIIAGTATQERIEKADWYMEDMRKALEEMEK